MVICRISNSNFAYGGNNPLQHSALILNNGMVQVGQKLTDINTAEDFENSLSGCWNSNTRLIFGGFGTSKQMNLEWIELDRGYRSLITRKAGAGQE